MQSASDVKRELVNSQRAARLLKRTGDRCDRVGIADRAAEISLAEGVAEREHRGKGQRVHRFTPCPRPAGLYQVELASLTVADTAPPVIEARLPTSISSSLPARAEVANEMEPISVNPTRRARIAAQHSARAAARQPHRARRSAAPFSDARRARSHRRGALLSCWTATQMLGGIV